MRALVALGTAGLLVLAGAPGVRPSPAAAQPRVRTRTIGVRWDHGVPRISVSSSDLVTADVRRKLESGLPQTLVTRIYAYPESGGSPIAVTPLQCRVAYDLWEEVFRVQVQTASGDRSESASTIEQVVRRCLVARDVPVGTTADYAARRGSRVYFAVLVELNPMSPDTVQRIRRWLARPNGGRLDGDAFFGSFVSMFVNRRIGAAERTLSFRSQAVSVP
jgi:hypothetical protein